jgi:Na+/phosphate symporter
LLKSSHDSNNFASGQIHSSTASVTLGLGFFDDGSSQVTVAYSYYGDANLDGTVNALDFNALASHFGSVNASVWTQGDFNYDGVVNSLDFDALAINFNQALPQATLGALVPDPVSFNALCIVAATMLTRRREAQAGGTVSRATVLIMDGSTSTFIRPLALRGTRRR